MISLRRPSPRHTRDVVACWCLHAKEKRKRQTQTKGEEEEADTATPRGKRKRQPHNFNHFLTNQPHNSFFLENTGFHDFRSLVMKYTVLSVDFWSLVMIYLILIRDYCSLVMKS